VGITHHDGCFGCGLANLFGLQMELERVGEGGVRGRFFVKQDHQGPPGIAHGGVVGAALDEAMALLLHDQGIPAVTSRLEIELARPAPVGEFVEVSARIAARDGRRFELVAEASGAAGVLARALGVFTEIEGYSR
jgi:acyl-coenzyme A thioesterase PaaI-like protein